jgi:hypothetical protein
MNNIIRSNAIGKVNGKKILGMKVSNFPFSRLCNSINSLICLILRTVKAVNLSTATENIHIRIKNQDNGNKFLVGNPKSKILFNQHQIQEKYREMLGMTIIGSSGKKPVIQRLRDLSIVRDISIWKILNIWYLNLRKSNLRLSI